MNCCSVNIVPCILSKSHHLKLVDIVDVGGSDIDFIEINCILNKLSMVMSFERTNDALVVRLYVCSEIWLEIFDLNVGEIIGNDVV